MLYVGTSTMTDVEVHVLCRVGLLTMKRNYVEDA